MANTDIREATSYYNTGPRAIDNLMSYEFEDLPDHSVINLGSPQVLGLPPNPYINAVLGDPYCQSVEALLPKYNMRGATGSAEISQARMYFTEPASKARMDILNEIPGIVVSEDRAYVGFLLSSVTENRREKVQTMPLHGDNYLATFYGESPRSYNFSGLLYNTRNASWRDIFTKLYDFLFRGSACAKNRTLTQIVYDNRIVSGWLTDLNQTLNSTSEQMVSFGFNMLIRQEVILADANKLSYNNAYFTGFKDSFNRTDGIDALPQYSSYLNTARIKPPPRPRRASGVRRPSCRISRAGLRSNNRTEASRTAVRPSTSQSSPLPSNCDISQAILQSRRAYQQKVARINNSSLNEQRKREALDDLNRQQEFTDLQNFYAGETVTVLPEAEQNRLNALRGQEGFRSFDEIRNPNLEVNYSEISSKLPKLNDSTSEGTESAESADAPAAEAESGEAQPAPEEE